MGKNEGYGDKSHKGAKASAQGKRTEREPPWVMETKKTVALESKKKIQSRLDRVADNWK